MLSYGLQLSQWEDFDFSSPSVPDNLKISAMINLIDFLVISKVIV